MPTIARSRTAKSPRLQVQTATRSGVRNNVESHRASIIYNPVSSSEISKQKNGDGTALVSNTSAIGGVSLTLPTLTSIYGLPCFNCPDIDRCGTGLPINPVVCEKISLWLLRVRRSEPIAAT